MRRPSLLSAALVAALLVALQATAALAAEVRLTADGFAPRRVQVQVGEEIVWVNDGNRTRTVVGEDGTWDSGPLRPGEAFSIALREPGTVRYATADGEMAGVISVLEPVEASEAPPDEAVTPVAAGDAPLPDTGAPAPGLLAAGLALTALGALTLRGARALRSRTDS